MLVTRRKWHMFAPAVAFPVCSRREGTRHAFIHRFLEVLVLVSRANERNTVGRRVFERIASTRGDLVLPFVILTFLLCQAHLKLQPVSSLLFPKNGEACVCFRRLQRLKKKLG